MNDDLYYLNRFTGTDIVVDESDVGVVEKLNWTCSSTQEANPTPDAPKPIYSSGDGGKIVMWSHKKNMFDISNANILNGVYATTTGTIGLASGNKFIYIPCNSATTYTISKSVTDRFRVGSYPTIVTKGNVLNSFTYSDSAASRTLTTGANDKFLFVQYTASSQDIPANLQIEQSSSATTYEPYTGSTTDITTPVGYVGGSLPNGVADSDAQKKIGKIVLNGSESGWSLVTSGETPYYRYRYLTNYVATTSNLSCNMFIPNSISTSGSELGCSIISTGEVRFREATMRTIENWKTFLASNNLILYYELATPETITITKPSVSTYEGINYITTTNNVKPSLTIEAWKR